MIYTMFTDGGSRGNPGPAASGWVIYENSSSTPTIAGKGSKYLGIQTNNYAEYTAILEGLKQCLELNITNLQVKMDSELAYKQLIGVYKIKNDAIRGFVTEIHQLVKKFNQVNFSHVYRESNKVADKLVNECLDQHRRI